MQTMEECQALLLSVKNSEPNGARIENLKKNVVRSLANALQDIRNEYARKNTAYNTGQFTCYTNFITWYTIDRIHFILEFRYIQ